MKRSSAPTVSMGLVCFYLVLAVGPNAQAASIQHPEHARRVEGSPAADRIASGPADDNVFGKSGDDSLRLGAGDDYADGGAGSDDIWGGLGDDAIDGGIGKDRIRGGAGDDEIVAYGSRITVWGGGGNDTVSKLRSIGVIHALLGSGSDAMTIVANGRRDVIDCGRGADEVHYIGRPDSTDKIRSCEVVSYQLK